MEHLNENQDKKLKTACIIVGGLIIAGLFVPYLNIAALIAAAYFVFTLQLEEIVCFMTFMVSFCTIFKISLGGFSLYNFLLVIAIFRLISMSHYRLSGRFIPSFMLLSVYILATGFNNDIMGSISCICYILFIGIVCSMSKMRLNPKRVTLSSVWGIIITSVLALLSDYIPRLATIISQARIKLDTGEYYYRFSGIEANPNYYTMMISVCIAVLVVFILQHKTKVIDYIYLAVLCVFGFMSVSNSFLLSLTVILLMFAFSRKVNGRSNFGTAIIVGIAVFSAVMMLNQDVITTLQFRINMVSTSTSLSDSTTGRSVMWLSYLTYWYNNLLALMFGRGVGAPNLSVGASHNYFIDIIYYIGLAGGTVYFICLSKIFNPRYLLIKRPRIYHYIPIGTFVVRALARNLFMSEQLVFMLLICSLAIYSGNIKADVLEA